MMLIIWLQEVFKMHALSHPNVMSLTGVCLDTGGGPAVVMPYMEIGSCPLYIIVSQLSRT